MYPTAALASCYSFQFIFTSLSNLITNLSHFSLTQLNTEPTKIWNVYGNSFQRAEHLTEYKGKFVLI
jgi:hypothetical protein